MPDVNITKKRNRLTYVTINRSAFSKSCYILLSVTFEKKLQLIWYYQGLSRINVKLSSCCSYIRQTL